MDHVPGRRTNHEAESAAALRLRARTCIAQSGMTQQEFARQIDLDHTKLSKALHGKRRFKPDELVRIATESGVTVNWLVTGSDATAGTTSVPLARSLPKRIQDEPATSRTFHTIVQAAWEQFSAQGYHAVRIADIAESCGMSSSNVYHHFSSKRELFEESLRYSVKLAFDRQVASLDPASSPLERLHHLVELQLPGTELLVAEWSIWLQSWTAVAVGEASKQNQEQAYRRWYRTVHALLLEGQAAGEVIDVPVAGLSTELTSLIDGLGIKVLVGALSAEQMNSAVHRFIDSTLATRSRPVS